MEILQNYTVGEVLQMFANGIRGIIAQEVKTALDEAKNEPKKMYSRTEVCNLLHISKPTLWKWEKDGEIQATRAGRRVLFTTEELNRVLQLNGRATV